MFDLPTFFPVVKISLDIETNLKLVLAMHALRFNHGISCSRKGLIKNFLMNFYHFLLSRLWGWNTKVSQFYYTILAFMPEIHIFMSS